MKLYCFPTPRNACVFALADHLEVTLERVSVDLTKGAQNTPDFLKINPNGKTPVLVDGDLCLWEHAAILLYLAEKTGSALAAKSAAGRAEAIRWISWVQMHWTAGGDILGWEYMAKPALGLGGPDHAEVARGIELLGPLVPIVDGHLAKNDYFLGSSLSFVDFMFGGAVAHWQTCRMPLENARNLLGWCDRLSRLPAWRENFAQRETV